jgi:hypothetical protein
VLGGELLARRSQAVAHVVAHRRLATATELGGSKPFLDMARTLRLKP